MNGGIVSLLCCNTAFKSIILNTIRVKEHSLAVRQPNISGLGTMKVPLAPGGCEGLLMKEAKRVTVNMRC